MMFTTHLSLGLLVGLLMTRTFSIPANEYAFLLILAVASVLPDIDTAHSLLGRRVKVVSMAFSHRGVIHSLFAMVIFGIIFILFLPNAYYLAALIMGYFSHLMLDSLTPMGLPLFWPRRKRVNGSLKTFGFFDWLLLIIFFSLDVIILI
jgi:inner membrane protein